MSFIKAALAILYVTIFGYGLLKLILKDKNPFSVFGQLPISFVLGFGSLAFWSILLMLVRLRLSFWPLALPGLPFFVYGLSRLRLNFDGQLLIEKIKSLKWTEVLLILAIIFGVGSVFLMSVAFPLHFWDSRAIWGLKAKMLFGDGTIFLPNFLDPARVMPHFRYPLLYPLAQAFIYFAVGQIDDWAVMVLVGLFFPLLVMFLYEFLRLATKEREKALMGAAALAVMPVFFMIDGPAHAGYADTPLALYFLVSFGALFFWKLLNEPRLLVMGGLLSAVLPLVKNEGMTLLLINLIWVGWPDNWRLKEWRRSLRETAICVFLAAVIVLPWLILRSYIPNAQTIKYEEQANAGTIIRNLVYVPRIIGFYLAAFFGFQASLIGYKFMWGGWWAIYALAVIDAFLKHGRLALRLFWLFILFCLFMGFIYEIAPEVGAAGDMSGNFFRLMLPITPLAVILVMLQAQQISFGPAIQAKARHEKGKRK